MRQRKSSEPLARSRNDSVIKCRLDDFKHAFVQHSVCACRVTAATEQQASRFARKKKNV
jgi:hypothetical protein